MYCHIAAESRYGFGRNGLDRTLWVIGVIWMGHYPEGL